MGTCNFLQCKAANETEVQFILLKLPHIQRILVIMTVFVVKGFAVKLNLLL